MDILFEVALFAIAVIFVVGILWQCVFTSYRAHRNVVLRQFLDTLDNGPTPSDRVPDGQE